MSWRPGPIYSLYRPLIGERLTREVFGAWCRRVGPSPAGVINNRLPADQVQALFNDMQLFPSNTQVGEMLQCAKECAVDRGNGAGSYLTFSEFCVFATELKRCYEKGISCPGSLTRLLDQNGVERKRKTRRMPKVIAKDEVFLGGSCNPTTWRQNVAIPLLEKLGITYYNPQVEEWSADLLELEHVAKEQASVLFYVIDSQTRNIAGVIEAAHLAGARRKLVLVLDKYQPGQSLASGTETISQLEYEELSAGVQVLQDLVEKQGIPVFDNIPVAINCTAKVLRDDLNGQDGNLSSIQCNNADNHQVGERLMRLREAFNALEKNRCGQISLTDVCIACRVLTNRKLSVAELKSLVASQTDCNDIERRVNFEEFCSIISKLKTAPNGTNEKWTLCWRPFGAPGVNIYDVFLGGCSSSSQWTDNVAIPILNKHKLTFYRPKSSSKRLDASDLSAMDNCYLLLFHIPNCIRGLTIMATAAHYIGLGCNVVLCIEQIPERRKSIVQNELLSAQAVNDYNRGRVYLRDLAIRDDIPVFDNIEEAIQCVLEKLTAC
ncbi:uncharacterized protein LOC111044525 isoform X2 [Nilaparvata lugens]|uniref:uncharacterized protein LOC111044525 isoform X2 n=1 Tax=Nilaparvata lugens TaxID=108931 RepID=UPI00193E9CD7|nr:uncharacterized protein LOC111044525 isoform X2 [Nilaparvata lugens]XP_039288244.1 uncharacterized protein LOC111044525 isoform X2 [Nilaparvata lugens]